MLSTCGAPTMATEGGRGMHLRASVALNNKAVNLYEEKKCLEAHLVLKETLGILRQGFLARHDRARVSLAWNPDQILSRAMSNAGRLRPQPRSFPLPIRVISDDSFSPLHSSLSDFSCESYCFVRIEVNESLDSIDEDAVLASVAYNYGLSFLCLARLSPSPRRGAKLKYNAIKIFQIAKRFVSCGSPCSPYPGLLLVGALLARAAFQALVELGHLQQARQSLHALNQVELNFEATRLLFHSDSAMSSCHKAPAA